jgi:PAS domain S-box-containing protein
MAVTGWTVIALSLIWANRIWIQPQLPIILVSHGTIWIAGLIGIYTATQRLKKHFQEKEEIISSVQKSREEYHTILRTAMDGFWQVDLDGNLLEVNDAYCRMSGYSREEFLRMNISELDVNEKAVELKEHIKNVIANATDRFESVHRRKDNSLFPVEVNMHYLEAGKLFVFLRDMTSQKHAEMALRESSRRISETLQNIQLIAVSLDKNGHVAFSNNFLLTLTGWSKDELIGKNWFDACLPQDNSAEIKAIFNQFISDGVIPVAFENEILTRDGQRRMVRWSNTVLRDVEGRVVGTSSIGEDITEQKRVQESLRENESLLMQAQQVANFGYYQLDIQSGVWKSSDILDDIFGIEKDYPKSVQGWTDIVHPDEREEMAAYFANEVLGKKKNFDREYRIMRIQDRQIRWVHGLGKLQFDAQGDPVRMIGAIQDITERKQAEEARIKAQQNYESLIQSIDGIVWEADVQTFEYSFVSRQAEHILGYPVERWIKEPNFWVEHIHPEDRDKSINFCITQTKEKKTYEFEYRMIASDEKIVWLRDMVSVIAEDGRPVKLRGIMIDITERKRAEEALKKSEELYHNMVETSQDLIWECDAEGRYTYLNPAWEQAFGYKIEEMLGKKFSDFQTPEMALRDQREFAYLIQGNAVKGFETVHIGKSGREINLVFNAKFLLDNDGQVCGTLGTAYDITERKRSENENLEKAKELEALFKISSHLRTAQTSQEMIPVVLKQMSQTLNTDANAVILLDADRTRFTYTLGDGLLAVNTGMHFDAENSISGRIMQTRQPYVTADYPSDPLRSRTIRDSEGIGPAVLVPLQSESEFTGTLLCARAKDSQAGPFTFAEVKLLTAIGEMVGNALRRATLYDDALSRLQRVQALRSIDAAINANMDSVITLRVLINQILSLMKVDAAAALLYNPVLHTLEFSAAHGFRYNGIENTNQKLTHGFANTAIIERRLIEIPNLAQAEDPIYREIALKEGFTSCYIAPMIAKGQVCGLLEVYSRSAFTPNQEWLDFLEALGGQAAIAINNAQLFTNLERSNLELSLAYDATIEGWSQALDLKDRETEGHTLRVTSWTVELAKIAGLSEFEIMHVRRGALLHDIGKMGIPDNILKKAGKLTPKEWVIMRQHTQYAYDMIHPIEFLRPAIDIPYCHHEKWDGTGYPRGLKSEQIPFVARLFSVIDVWDAVTSNRPYRKAWSFKTAIEHIKSESGKHFDPQIVKLFIEETDRFTRNGQIK